MRIDRQFMLKLATLVSCCLSPAALGALRWRLPMTTALGEFNAAHLDNCLQEKLIHVSNRALAAVSGRRQFASMSF
jgi:hypothetical protein